jgi:hypothetical protein
MHRLTWLRKKGNCSNPNPIDLLRADALPSRNLDRFPGLTVNRPINAGVGKHRNRIRNSALGWPTGFSYVLAECGLKLRERTKRAETGGRIRTFVDND